MTAGVTTPNLTHTAISDTVLVNRGGTTMAQPTSSLAQQVAADPALAGPISGLASKEEVAALQGVIFTDAKAYTTTGEGLAATSEGDQFIVPSGDEIIRYRHDAGPVATILARYPAANSTALRRRLDNIGEQLTTAPAALDYSTGVTQVATTEYLAGAGADFYWKVAPSGDAASVDLYLRVLSGAPQAITVDQRTTAATLIAGTAVTMVDLGFGLWGVRGLVRGGTFDHFRVRVQNAAGSPDLRFEAPLAVAGGSVPLELARGSDSAAAALLGAAEANAIPNRFAGLSVHNNVGAGAVLSGRTVIVPEGTRAELRIDASAFAPSDTIRIIFRASKAFRAGTFDCLPHTGLPGGSGATLLGRLRALGRGWFEYTRPNSSAASAAQASYLAVVLDNRSNGAAFVASGPVTFSDFWIAPNAAERPSLVTAPAVVMQALGDSGALTLWVDPAGSDGASGSRGAPLATVSAALARGASRVMLRKSSAPHRTTGLVPSRPVEFIGFSGTGDTASHARIWSSQRVVQSDFAATVSDAAVRFRPLAASPGAIWQMTGTGAVRFGRVQADPLGPRAAFAQPEADEAGVRAGAGRWWWGNGSEGLGLYLRPPADIWTGVGFEVPLADRGVDLAGVDVLFDGIEVAFARANLARIDRSTVRSRRSRFAHSGTSDGIDFTATPSHWIDEGDCSFEDAGDDGINTVGGGVTFVSLGGSSANRNVGDGIAPHGDGQTIKALNMQMTGNGKQGFVTIGTGHFELSGCDCRGNAERDILVLLGALTSATTVRISGCTADECEVSADTASAIDADILEHRGPLTLKANARVLGHTTNRAARGLRVDGGAVTVEDFSYRGSTVAGVDLRGGSLTLRSGEILRGATGISNSGGTLTLDATNPVNVPTSGTTGAPAIRTAGMTTEEVAMLASIAGV